MAELNVNDLTNIKEVFPIQTRKRKLERKTEADFEVDKTYNRFTTYRVESEEQKNFRGWQHSSTLENNKLTFRIAANDGALLEPRKITFVTQCKIQLKSKATSESGVFEWEDWTATRHRSYATDTSAPTQLRARWCCPPVVQQGVEVEMNLTDRLNVAKPNHPLKYHLRRLLHTTDADKRHREKAYFRGEWYDFTKSDFGSFNAHPARNRAGYTDENAQKNLNHDQTPVLQIEEEMEENEGVFRYEAPIENAFFEREELIPGWQTFQVHIFLGDDSNLVVAREANADGVGTPLTKEQVRVLWNLSETYIKIPTQQTFLDEGIETLIKENITYLCDDQTHLLISEPFPNTIVSPEGHELNAFQSDFGGMPKKAYFCIVPEKDVRGEGDFGRDPFSVLPWNIEKLELKAGQTPIFNETNFIPWNPKTPNVRTMIYKMLLDADGPVEVRREQRGSTERDNLQYGCWVGYYNMDPNKTGMNGFVEKDNIKPTVRVWTNQTGEKANGNYQVLLVFFEPQTITCLSTTHNRWQSTSNINQDLKTNTIPQSAFGGNPSRY